MKKIKLMTDYDCFPVWDCEEPGNIDPRSLPISNELLDKINVWAKIYDETMDWSDPSSAGFSSDEAEVEFENSGKRIWQELTRELEGKYVVLYFSNSEQKLISN